MSNGDATRGGRLRRWALGALVVLAVPIAIGVYLLARGPRRYVEEVFALANRQAIVVTTTSLEDAYERELTLTRVDDVGEPIWTTRVMTRGGNVGDVRSSDADPEMLVLRVEPVRDTHIVGIDARDGHVAWDFPLALAFEALVDGADLWVAAGSTLEKRSASDGSLVWRATHDIGQVVVSRGAAIAPGAYFAADGSRLDQAGLRRSSWKDDACLVGDDVIGMRTVIDYPRDTPGVMPVTYLGLDGSMKVRATETPARWRDNFVEIGDGVCGSAPTVDVLTIDHDLERDVIGIDRATRTLRWAIPFGTERLFGGLAPDVVRPSRSSGRLPRYLGVIVTSAGSTKLRDDYRLDMLDLDAGRVVWSLPLAHEAKYGPGSFRTACCQVVASAESSSLIAVSSATGEIVKAVDYAPRFELGERGKVVDDMIWLVDDELRAAFGYRLPDFVSANPDAPVRADETLAVSKRVVHR